jgi:single-strand DNA-binding protein
MSVNKIILIGNVGKDPETKTLPGGAVVTKFSLATEESWKDKSGERKNHTEWHTIECWGKTAEFVSTYVKKGRALYVEGSIRTDQVGEGSEKKYFTKIRAQVVRFIGPRPSDSTSGEDDQDVPF